MVIKKKLGRGLSDLGLGELLSGLNKPSEINKTNEAPQKTVTTITAIATKTGAAKDKNATPSQSRSITTAPASASSATSVAAPAAPTAAAPAVTHDVKAQERSTEHSSQHGLRKAGVELLRPSKYQPRQDFDQTNLDELAASIKAQGIIQPILVRQYTSSNKDAKGEYEIIAGERRWRAAQLAGLSEVPIIVREISDEQAAAVALIENLQREDLNAIDAAQGLQRLINEFGMTHQTVATAVGKSRTTITNLLRLLSLPDDVKNMVQRGRVEMGHARALLALPPHQQLATANLVISKKLSVRATEKLVQKMQQQSAATGKDSSDDDNSIILGSGNKTNWRHLDPNIAALQKKLSDALGAKVAIQYSGKGKNKGQGKLIVHYNTLDELDGIVAHLTHET